MRRKAAVLVALGLVAGRAAAVEPMDLLPANAECVGQLEVKGFSGWRYAERVLDALPKFKAALKRHGVLPLVGVQRISGAATRSSANQAEGVLVLEAQSGRPQWAPLGGGLFATGQRRLMSDLTKRAKRNAVDPPRQLLSWAQALFGLGPDAGAARGVCLVSPRMKAEARKDWPEADSAQRVQFLLTFDQGLKLDGEVLMTNPGAAASLITRAKSVAAKLPKGLFGAFVTPLQLSQEGERVVVRYVMPAPLLERALNMLGLMKDLSESTGDVVR